MYTARTLPVETALIFRIYFSHAVLFPLKIDVLESHAGQPHVHQAFQRALLAVVLLNAAQRTAYADGKVALATSLLRHLQTTVDTMLAPGFAVTEVRHPPLPPPPHSGV